MKIAPIHKSVTLDIYSAETAIELELPYVENGISAGFPSPAEDFIDISIDLNKEFIQNPNSTFYGRVRGDSMIGAGLNNGDLLIIDKSLEATDNKIAVCFIDGEFTVKRIKIVEDCIYLVAENEAYSPIKVTEENDFIVWGIVTTVIKSL